MKKGCHIEKIGKLLVSLADAKLMTTFTNALTLRNNRVVDSCSENSSESFDPGFQNGSVPIELMTEHSSQNLSQSQNDTKIGEIMDNVTKAITNSQVDETLADIFDLNEYRLMAHKRQIESLKASLKSGDLRITEAGLINVHLESEITKFAQ
jgi:hypothetical protein